MKQADLLPVAELGFIFGLGYASLKLKPAGEVQVQFFFLKLPQ